MKRLFGVALIFFFAVGAFGQPNYVGRYDVFGGFSYLESPKLDLQQAGFNTQIGVNLRRWLAFGFDYSIQSGDTILVPGELKPRYQALLPTIPGYKLYVPFDATTQTFALGPQLEYRHFKKFTLFVHPSIGVIHESITLKPHDAITTGIVNALLTRGVLHTKSPDDTTYFYGFGGGIEYNASKHLHIRADAEFVHVFLYSDLLKDSRNSIRFSIGPTFNFGRNVRK